MAYKRGSLEPVQFFRTNKIFAKPARPSRLGAHAGSFSNDPQTEYFIKRPVWTRSDLIGAGFLPDRMTGKALDGLASYAEVGGRREHVAIIGPHCMLADFVRRRKVYCVGGAYEDIAGTGNHQRTGPP